MFNSVDMPRHDLIHDAFRPTVSHAGKYEGKDNPGGGMYYRRAKEQKEEAKKDRPKSNHKIDLVA